MENEDNHTLLMMVLKKQFHDRPNVVDEAMEIIQNYIRTDVSTKTEYVKTLNTLYDMMVELPSNILLFFLTMVPLPQQEDCKSTVMELMKLTHNSLPENIRPVLISYLNNPSTSQIDSPKDEVKNEKVDSDMEVIKDVSEAVFLKPTVKRTRKRKHPGEKVADNDYSNESVKSLVEICAEYVVTRQEQLKRFYNKNKDKVWDLLNRNVYESEEEKLKQCYEFIKDLNKKIKLLRMIENDNITAEFIEEEYGSSEIFLKQYNMYDVCYDPFEPTEELKREVAEHVRS